MSGSIMIHKIPSLNLIQTFNSYCALTRNLFEIEFSVLVVKIHPLAGFCLKLLHVKVASYCCIFFHYRSRWCWHHTIPVFVTEYLTCHHIQLLFTCYIAKYPKVPFAKTDTTSIRQVWLRDLHLLNVVCHVC